MCEQCEQLCEQRAARRARRRGAARSWRARCEQRSGAASCSRVEPERSPRQRRGAALARASSRSARHASDADAALARASSRSARHASDAALRLLARRAGRSRVVAASRGQLQLTKSIPRCVPLLTVQRCDENSEPAAGELEAGGRWTATFRRRTANSPSMRAHESARRTTQEHELEHFLYTDVN
jgi:hypothetical protein